MSHVSVAQPREVLAQIPSFVGVSVASRCIEVRYAESMRHFASPATRRPLALRERFAALAQRWYDDTRFLSSATRMVAHPAYLQIIGMGEAVLPLILRELEKTETFWAPALVAITGIDPTSRDDWGDVHAIATAWLEWARGQGIRW
jgi:hypothetical protein